jgi:predicted metalloprotease
VQWTPGGESSDIEDRRGSGGGGGFGFGGGGFGGIHLGIGGFLVMLVLSFVFKQNLFSVFTGSSPAPATRPYSGDADRSAGDDRETQFISFVLDDVQHTWEQLLPAQANVQYHHAKLVLFTNYTDSGCGTAQSATGPFYCPEDEKVYIDLGFFQELSSRFGAPGEFAQAYVVAHELGHHVQKLLGTEQRVSRLQHNDPSERNPLSVRLELQADCYAGVWGHSTQQRKIIDQADIAAGWNAAAAVGDDRLQRMSSGHVSPESFTHGSSAQRMEWFRRGLDGGQISACNTFEGTTR